jgi:redox-sensitive bicupin YhaK (pirin superfamily)
MPIRSRVGLDDRDPIQGDAHGQRDRHSVVAPLVLHVEAGFAVMNTAAEIGQALADLRDGTFLRDR